MMKRLLLKGLVLVILVTSFSCKTFPTALTSASSSIVPGSAQSTIQVANLGDAELTFLGRAIRQVVASEQSSGTYAQKQTELSLIDSLASKIESHPTDEVIHVVTDRTQGQDLAQDTANEFGEELAQWSTLGVGAALLPPPFQIAAVSTYVVSELATKYAPIIVEQLTMGSMGTVTVQTPGRGSIWIIYDRGSMKATVNVNLPGSPPQLAYMSVPFVQQSGGNAGSNVAAWPWSYTVDWARVWFYLKLGEANPTFPVISNVSKITPDANQMIVIQGRGFGNHSSYNGDSPYIQITDVNLSWNAGYIEANPAPRAGDTITLNVTSWTDNQIIVSGFTGSYGWGWILNPGDVVRIQVWSVPTLAGPATYDTVCASTATSSPMPTTPTTPSIETLNGKIAFVSARDGHGNIYFMDTDGSDQTQVTNDPLGIGWFTLSPDCTKIAFFSSRSGKCQIYIMNIDGGNLTCLTNDPEGAFLPAWSPDGTKITFSSRRNGGLFAVYVMNVDGSNQIPLTNPPQQDSDSVWSPDGSKIAFQSGRNGISEIFVMSADGSSQTRVAKNPPGSDGLALPAWSPDGKKIVFCANFANGKGDIYVVNVDGTNQTRLTDNPADDSDPVWSPDGAKIAFTSNRDGNQEIYIMNSDGSNQTRLTNNPALDQGPVWVRTTATPPTTTATSLTTKAPTILGKIIVIKRTNPSSASGPFAFWASYGPQIGYPNNFFLQDGQQLDSGFTLSAGIYNIGEALTTEWQLTGISINDPSGGSSSNGKMATIDLAAGETVTVIFNNTKSQLLPPVISSVSKITSEANQTIIIQGRGFGNHSPYNSNSPYIQIADINRSWNAGYIEANPAPGAGDAVTLNVTSWTDNQIIVSGFTGLYGQGWALYEGDTIRIQV